MKHYKDINNLLNQSGFAWDERLQIIVADDDKWDAYIKEGLMYIALLPQAERLFLQLEPVTTRSPRDSFTATPGVTIGSIVKSWPNNLEEHPRCNRLQK
ncbi:unnamed protein product [Camellia sinensis]